MNGFRATARRTYGRTHGLESLDLQRLRRETKKIVWEKGGHEVGKNGKMMKSGFFARNHFFSRYV